MKRIAFIIPWYGKLPNYFRFWLKTAEANETVDFLFFTDQKPDLELPSNVKFFCIKFEDLKNAFQSVFDFRICLDNAYKFCDFRPAYGVIFKEYLHNYDFWGHIDIDTFLGDIRSFITDEILDKYNKVLARGHFTLYKNDPVVNNWYKTLQHKDVISYKHALTNPNFFQFDEYGGISRVIEKLNIPMYKERIFADLKMESGKLIINKKENIKVRYFIWDNGQLESVDSTGKKEKWLYLHYQKRNSVVPLNVDYNLLNKFYYCSPNIISLDPREDASFFVKKNFEIKYWKKTILNKFKRILNNVR